MYIHVVRDGLYTIHNNLCNSYLRTAMVPGINDVNAQIDVNFNILHQLFGLDDVKLSTILSQDLGFHLF